MNKADCTTCGLIVSARLAEVALYKADKELKHSAGYICNAICALHASINSLLADSSPTGSRIEKVKK